MPLASSYVLSKKAGKCAWVEPHREDDHFIFSVHNGIKLPKLREPKKGRGAAFVCPGCGAITTDAYVKEKGNAGEIGAQLMAIVAEGEHGRIYLPPDEQHVRAAAVEKPESYPEGSLPTNPRWFSPPAFGMREYHQLFTNRQLTALTTFSALVGEAQKQAEADAVAAGLPDDSIPLDQGGTGAKAYGEAMGVYLAFGVSRMADIDNNLCSWETTKTQVRHLFTRQAIPMLWDFGENNVFNNAAGDYTTSLESIIRVIERFDFTQSIGIAKQNDAQLDCGLRSIMVSTDPPYYDNIDYADLSDFFYIWLRQSLKHVYPDLFRSMLAPKIEELIATPYRHNGDMDKAKKFFEDGMYNSCCRIHQYACEDVPVTIYYAFKQSETDGDDKTASSGWETMLSAIIRAGFAITGTWPMRTELANRSVGRGTNALASSIVLVCRKRAVDARDVSRREFINALHREMRPALEKLQSANIAPVDLAQSAIGPGIAVFSRYRRVLEANGEPMSVRAALQIINQELDAFYNAQEGELDRESRFCVELFSQSAFNTIKFGDADILARAKNTSVQALAERGVLRAAKGQVRLLPREEISEQVNPSEPCIWLLTQQLARAMELGGVRACAEIAAGLFGSNAEYAKALAYRLYTICERKGWAQEGYAYNNLVVAWPDIQAMAAEFAAQSARQISLDDVIHGEA